MNSSKFQRITSYYPLLQNTKWKAAVTAARGCLPPIILNPSGISVWDKHSKTSRGDISSWKYGDESRPASEEKAKSHLILSSLARLLKQAWHSLFWLVNIQQNQGGLAILWLIFTY